MVIYWFVKPQRKAMRSDKMFIELIDDTNCGFNPTPKIYTEYAPTLRAGRYGLKIKECDEMNNLRIRKLTPKE